MRKTQGFIINEHQSAENESGINYLCPMGCEGEITYNKAGNCPVCNMKLIPVGTDASAHGHH